ncbi:DUF4962 domain-containing protein [Paenibacillus sp. GCM10023252]|uniref:DUF4962 domain-containing protein n=1 Tax=Paenibacillus sp. GCM10023252 TaxID=3252649 RepID=UPI00360C7D8B
MMNVVRSVSALLVFTTVALAAAYPAAEAEAYTVNQTTLTSYNNVHPRMYINDAKVNNLRTTIQAGGTHASLWGSFQDNMNQLLTKTPPPVNYSDGSDSEEWQRPNGTNMSNLAMAYLLTQNRTLSVTRWLEAEDGELASPMQAYSEAGAAGGKYVMVPSNGTTLSAPSPLDPPHANYSLTLPGNTNYHIWARVQLPDTGAHSFYMAFDSGNYEYMGGPEAAGWQWVKIKSNVKLVEGEHQLKIRYRQSRVKIDKLMFTTDAAYSPSGLGTEQHWLQAEDGVLASPMQIYTDDVVATKGKYISVKSASNWAPTPVDNAAPDARYQFNATGGVNYSVWARVKAPSDDADSFYYNMDGGSYATSYPAYGTEWIWHKVMTVNNLVSGSHTINLKYRNTNLKLDSILITSDTSAGAPSDPNKYLMAGLSWATASLNYPTWGNGTTNTNNDLAAAHQLLGLGLFYDWLFHHLTDTTKNSIRDRLIERGAIMNDSALAINGQDGWWREDYMGNHLWVNMTGLAGAAAAIYDEHSPAIGWLNTATSKYTSVMNNLSDDGASHEGVGYWQYGMGYVTMYMELAKKLLGANLYGETWMTKTSDYALYNMLPRNSWTIANSHFQFADSPRSNWYGPGFILRTLANQYNDGTAQWLAQELLDSGIDDGDFQWLSLVNYNAGVSPVSPANAGKSTLKHFGDMGLVYARSGWSGDEAVIGFKSGPYMGHENLDNVEYDMGGAHVHPDVNHFSLFGNGEWLINDDGYAYKYTSNHNTLLIDGLGQMGDGGAWFSGWEYRVKNARPAIRKAYTSADFDHIIGEGAPAYTAGRNVSKYTRHLIFMKPDVLIVVDDIALSASHQMELRFFPEKQSYSQSGNSYLMQGSSAKLAVTPLTMSGVTASAGSVSRFDNTNTAKPSLAVRLQKTGTMWRNATALTWSAAGGTPKTVNYTDLGGGVWRFTAGTKTIELNLSTESAVLK